MFCTKCGKEILQQASFCINCGAPLPWPQEQTAAPAGEEPVVPVCEEAAPAPAIEQQAAPVFEQTAAPAGEPSAAPSCQAPFYSGAPALPVKQKSGKGGRIALIVVAAVLGLCLIGTSVYCVLLYRQCSSLADQVDTLREDNSELNYENFSLNESYDALSEEYASIREEFEFLHQHSVFCSDENEYYHSYDCPDWDRDAFWIYNSEYAQYREYTPCPYCQ